MNRYHRTCYFLSSERHLRVRSHAANDLRSKVSRKRLASVQTLQLDGLRQSLPKLPPVIDNVNKQQDLDITSPWPGQGEIGRQQQKQACRRLRNALLPHRQKRVRGMATVPSSCSPFCRKCTDQVLESAQKASSSARSLVFCYHTWQER